MGFDPLTMLVIAKTGMDVMQSQQQTRADKALARYNQRVSQGQADQVRAGVAEEQFAKRQDLKRLMSENEAMVATSGVQMKGSPIQHELQVIDDVSRDIAIMGHNAELEARGLESQAAAYGIQREQASKAGRIAIGQALVGGVGTYYHYKKPKGKGLISSEEKIDYTSRHADPGKELGRGR